MRLKGFLYKVKLFLWIVCLIGIGCFFVLPVFKPIRSEVVLLGHNLITSIRQAKESVVQKTKWRLNEVAVMGNKRTTKAQWRAALNLQKNQSMTEVDLDEVRDAFMGLPWVKSVVVARYLPDTLKIYITEKEPIALWQNQGQYRPLDETGTPIEDSTFSSSESILVVGADAPKHTLELLKALKQVPQLSEQIISAVRIEGRRWNLYTANDIKILLPQTDMLQSLIRLNRQNEKQGLLKKDVAAIDMRVSGKIKLTLRSQIKSKQKKGKK